MVAPRSLRPTFVPQRSARSADDPFVGSPRERTTPATRVLEIFEFFREVGRPARAIEISQALALPHSSVDRMLKTLVRQGYLWFDFEPRLYAPTRRVVAWGAEMGQAFQLGPGPQRVIEALHTQAGETACLCIQNDCWIHTVASVPGTHYHPAIHGEGMRAPLLGSSPGHVLMARRSDREVMDLARRARARGVLDLDDAGVAEMMMRVQQARRDGFAAWQGFSFPGALAVSVAVQAAPGQPPLAVALITQSTSQPQASADDAAARVQRAIDQWLV